MKKNSKKIKQFLESLEKVPIIQKACAECNISRNTIYRWKEDKKFKERMDKAIEMGESYINDLTHTKYYGLINKEYCPAIKYRLMHSLDLKEKTLLEMLDLETKKQREILEEWRDRNKKRYQEEKAKEQSENA